MLRKLLSLFGFQITYVSEYGEHKYRFDTIDAGMNGPLHEARSVGPAWAKMRISRAS